MYVLRSRGWETVTAIQDAEPPNHFGFCKVVVDSCAIFLWCIPEGGVSFMVTLCLSHKFIDNGVVL
jgi:hypothetical protein